MVGGTTVVIKNVKLKISELRCDCKASQSLKCSDSIFIPVRKHREGDHAFGVVVGSSLASILH